MVVGIDEKTAIQALDRLDPGLALLQGKAAARYTLPPKTKRVVELLATHGDVHMHLAPTYSSWINQGESWFANIELVFMVLHPNKKARCLAAPGLGSGKPLCTVYGLLAVGNGQAACGFSVV